MATEKYISPRTNEANVARDVKPVTDQGTQKLQV